MGYIEGKVDRWYCNTSSILPWDERKELIEMVAECIIASQMDSSICNEAFEISGVPIDPNGGLGNVQG